MPRKHVIDKQAMKRLELNPMEKRDVYDALERVVREIFEIDDPGELQLALFLDALVHPVAKLYYNKGVSDTRRFMAERLEDAASIEI